MYFLLLNAIEWSKKCEICRSQSSQNISTSRWISPSDQTRRSTAIRRTAVREMGGFRQSWVPSWGKHLKTLVHHRSMVPSGLREAFNRALIMSSLGQQRHFFPIRTQYKKKTRYTWNFFRFLFFISVFWGRIDGIISILFVL